MLYEKIANKPEFMVLGKCGINISFGRRTCLTTNSWRNMYDMCNIASQLHALPNYEPFSHSYHCLAFTWHSARFISLFSFNVFPITQLWNVFIAFHLEELFIASFALGNAQLDEVTWQRLHIKDVGRESVRLELLQIIFTYRYIQTSIYVNIVCVFLNL